MSETEKAAVLAAHTAVSRVAADIDANRPGPFELGAVVESLRAAVAPLGEILAATEAAVASAPAKGGDA